MNQGRVAARYARALFAIAKDRNQTGIISRELSALVSMWAGSPDLQELLGRPSLPPAVKRAAAGEIGARVGFSKLAADFLVLLAERGRVDHVAEIARKYEALLDTDLGRLRARVRTAVSLAGDERERLVATLVKALGVDQVALEELVDPTILGGFVVEADAILIDGSLRGQLDTLRGRLANGTSG